MLSYTHFTLVEERKYLQKLLSERYSQRKIAAILERNPSSVSREIRRNRAAYKPHRKSDNKYRRKYACAEESATGRATQYMAEQAKGCS